jgi:hypothetical protein
MIVVCDASPLIFLAKLNRLELITRLLGSEVVVLQCVASEVMESEKAGDIELRRLIVFLKSVRIPCQSGGGGLIPRAYGKLSRAGFGPDFGKRRGRPAQRPGISVDVNTGLSPEPNSSKSSVTTTVWSSARKRRSPPKSSPPPKTSRPSAAPASAWTTSTATPPPTTAWW